MHFFFKITISVGIFISNLSAFSKAQEVSSLLLNNIGY